ncbi:MAG: nuclear transport factor 2 family protein [Acidimicrobiia bacterium]|nr:nuclear transport factor 2 family protein [Acidimicrobiia bacterium]
MRKTLFLVTLLATLTIPLLASEAEIAAAEKNWAAAVVARDYAALEKVYSDDLIYAHSTGAVENKAEYMKRLRSGVQRYDKIEHQKTVVKLHGTTAIAHCHVRMTGSSNGEPFDNKIMMIHLWVKQSGQWRLAAHQTTRLP